MSDARWFEVDEDIAAAVKHFGMAVELLAAGDFDGEDIGAYRAQMALMHAMQSGHTSLESALVRVLELLGEEVPAGRDWHSDLIRRVSREIAGRPAILPLKLAMAAGKHGASTMSRCGVMARSTWSSRDHPCWPLA